MISFIMVLVMVFQLASPILTMAATSDRDTSTKYTESLGDNVSTEYAGRVWTDKSVFTTDVSFDTYGGGNVTVALEPEKNEDFLISYSALATSQSISGQSQAPVDVVLILDISGSMSNGESNMDNGRSRIYNTVQAANAAIDALMAMNPHTRVGVAVFSSNAQVLLPLGRYTKVGSYNYLSVNRQSASNNYADLTVRANNGSNNIQQTVDVEGGTNIQMGLYEGMKLLVDEQTTTANINGQTVQRAPSVILLSDGSPTYSSNSASWWAPQDNYNDGPGSSAYAGNGFKAILMGAYMKAAIDRNYGVAGTSYATTVYTVGMGITGLSDNEKNLANMTLNPGAYWNNNTSNTMKTTIKDYWTNYTRNNNTGTQNINVGQQVLQGNRWVYRDKNYWLTHPNTGYDVDPVSGYDYVDDYYSADNASAVTDVFEQIVSSISISAPQVPTEIKGDDPLTDGYITYTDPIGKYMEVKDVKSIIYAGTEFTQKTKSAANGVTTYTFTGEVHSPVYGNQDLHNILITVEEDADGDQTLVVKIPASVIPLRLNSVVLNPDGSVKSHTNNGAFPTRVIYSVGLQEGIKQVSDDGHEYVDATKLSEEYVLANVNGDGSINFYSNVFSNTNTVHGYSAGDATVEFEPSHSNPFYYILEDMPIYKDREFKQPVPNNEALDADTVYYYKEEFYHGNSVEVLAIARTGAQLTKTAITKGADGYQYRAAGSPRLNRILEFEGTKVENATGTAEDFYAPSFVYADGSSDPFEGKFVIYHGNNGVLSMQTGGNLEIRKEVAAAAGLTAPGETFTFKVDLDGEKINGGEYTYVIRDALQNEVSRGTVSAANDTISLQDGQIATIYSLPPHTTFQITEAPAAGFATESQGATGVIHAGQTQQALFTNTYSVQPVTSQVLQGKKVFNGREWESSDSFTFFLAPYNDCPLPVGYDVDEGITVSAPDVANGHEAAFTFGAIEFTAPGLYRYTVFEEEPENDGYLPGVTYSRALYRIAILVEDNGDGTLKIASSDIQRLYDDEANPLFTYGSSNQIVMNPGEEAQDEMVFTNTYSASSVIRVPTALKVYSDPSGTKPLVSGMFQFQIKALGYAVDGGELQNDITKVPMPEGSVNGVAVTTNEGHNITFPHVEFTQALIPDDAEYIIFRYELSEVIPDDQVPGMTYDETTFTVDVKVEIDHTDDVLKVSAIYPDDQRTAVFENSFKLQPVTADINGTKTLVGRDMLDGESFEFTLVGANAATNNAVRDGAVIVPDSAVTVSGGKNGKAKAFSFENIEFTKPGTFTFLVSETAGSAPAMVYDSSNISVTFVIADKNGDAKLDVVSTTYSNGKKSADFINTYSHSFNDTPVSLSGVKNLTGKSLLDGEFFFKVRELYNGDEVTERLVGHTGDDTATGGVYTGQMVFLEDVTYSEPGTYTYIITEQIPDEDHKVMGTQYDESKYRFVVEVEDDGQGNLMVASQKLQKASGSSWVSAQAIEFNNRYVPEATTLELPLIKKVVSGDRNKYLEENEFTFEMTTTAEDGIELPAQTVVGNLANGDIAFGAITFTKAGEYTVTIREVIPADEDKVPGITYTTKAVTAVFHVVDNRNGQLTATLAQLDRDTFINEYVPEPTAATISGRKELVGGTPEDGQFRFHLYQTASDYSIQELTPLATLANAADGSFRFDGTNVPELNYTAADTYHYVLVEDGSNPIQGIRYDTTQYRFAVTVTDNGDGTLKVETDCINGDAQNIIFRNVRHEEIVKKDVFAVTAPTVSIDGQAVNPGQVLEYTIRYKNYSGQTATVEIVDTIPANTEFLSAENGGVLVGNQVKWTVTNIAADQEITVRFRVKVSQLAQSVENTATVLEGNNTYTTNTVTTETVEDKVEKTVVAPNQPDISIDGQKVEVGQTLVYKITYTNQGDVPGQVTVTDTLPRFVEFISADNGGQLSQGTVTWNVSVPGGESKTVSVTVKVIAPNAFIDNQAIAIRDGHEVTSNIVTNHTYEEVGGKDVATVEKPTVSIDGQMVKVGQELVYTIHYTNVTDAPVDVTITDMVPQHTSYVQGSAVGATEEDNKLTWQFNGVQPRERIEVSFKVRVLDPGEQIANQAQIFDGTNKVTNRVVNSVPEKTVDKTEASAGESLTYTIRYTNTTGAKADVVITDRLAAALEYVDGTAGTGVYAGGTITWTLSGVENGDTVEVSFQAKIKADAAGQITNSAEIVENTVSVVTSNETVTEVLKPDLTIEKAQSVGTDAATTEKLEVKGKDVVTYYITVTNNGEGAANGVQVADKIPEGLAYVEGSASNGGTVENGIVSWELGTVEAGDRVTVTFQVKVPKLKENTSWTNVAAAIYENDPNGDEPIGSNEVVIELKVPANHETGDAFDPTIFLSIMILSGFGLAAMMIFRRREEEAEEA